jgi:hypothetical protein
MTRCGKHGKTIKLFSTLPTALGNRYRDFHITHGHDDGKENLSKLFKPKTEQ